MWCQHRVFMSNKLVLEVSLSKKTAAAHVMFHLLRSQEAMATVRQNGEVGKAEPLVPAPVEPSAEEGATAKKSKKRKVAEAQAVQAQAAEAANGAPGVCYTCLLLVFSVGSW